MNKIDWLLQQIRDGYVLTMSEKYGMERQAVKDKVIFDHKQLKKIEKAEEEGMAKWRIKKFLKNKLNTDFTLKYAEPGMKWETKSYNNTLIFKLVKH